jgi:hypothetical protein
LSSLTTLDINILAEAVPMWPVNKFSANFINRASAGRNIFYRCCILNWKVKARFVRSSPRKRNFWISEISSSFPYKFSWWWCICQYPQTFRHNCVLCNFLWNSPILA